MHEVTGTRVGSDDRSLSPDRARALAYLQEIRRLKQEHRETVAQLTKRLEAARREEDLLKKREPGLLKARASMEKIADILGCGLTYTTIVEAVTELAVQTGRLPIATKVGSR